MSGASGAFFAAGKCVGMMTLGPALAYSGLQGFKLYRDYTSTDEENTGNYANAVRKQSVMERLCSGATPPIAAFNEKYLEKNLKTNSAMREFADEIRQVYYGKAAV